MLQDVLSPQQSGANYEPIKKLSHTLWQSQYHIIWHSSILSTTGIHPLARNNQILLDERDF